MQYNKLTFSHLLISGILTIFLYTISTNEINAQWQELNKTPFLKHHSNGFGFDGKAYVLEGTFGDDGPTGVSNEVWEYTPDSDSWRQLNAFPGPGRGFSIGDDMNGKYYFGFGSGEFELLNDLWEYDPTTDTFTELPECPCVPRNHPGLVAHNNKIFVGGGNDQDGNMNDWWVFDLATNTWDRKDNIPGDRRHHPFQFGIDGAIYIGGGHVDNWSRFDIETETWTQIDDYPKGRVAGTQFSYKGKGYVLSGDNADHDELPTNELFIQYDPETDIWTEMPPHPLESRWACSSFIIDNFLYLFGGLKNGENDDDVSMWKFDMDKIACQPPKALSVVSITNTSAGLVWQEDNNETGTTLEYRKVNEPDWFSVNDPEPIFTLDNLDVCQEYEFRVLNACDSLSSDFSEVIRFTTDGCCINPELNFTTNQNNSALVQWTSSSAAENYEIRYRVAGESDWESIQTTDNTIIIEDLNPCAHYEFQSKMNCTNEPLDFGDIVNLYTDGCGECTEGDYCDVTNNYDSQDIFIDKVQIKNYVNESGNDNGYGDFALFNTDDMRLTSPFEIVIEPGFANAPRTVFVSVWIDYNADGFYSFSEKVLQERHSSTSGAFQETITPPNSAEPGITRMRVIISTEDNINACDSPFANEGEVEDYCVNLFMSSVSIDDLNNLNTIELYPNPFSDILNIEYDVEATISDATFEISDALGRVHHTQKITLQSGSSALNINTRDVPEGVSLIKIINDEGHILFSEKLVRLKK